MKTKICGIYKITSPSGKVYIGQSRNIKTRFRSYKNLKCKGQIKLYNSFIKYGVENHIFEIIEESNLEDLNCRERHWQDFYDVLNGGLNLVLQECGEKYFKISEETRQKMSQLHKGKIISEEQRKKLSDSNSGSGNPMYGLKGENHPAFGFKMNEEQRKNLSKRVKDGMTPEKIKTLSERFSGENNPMFGSKREGEDNPMFGKTGELHPSSEIYINLETGIFYFGQKEVANSFSHIPLGTIKSMLSGKVLNNTSIVKVDDYEKGTAIYNQTRKRQYRKLMNTETGEIYDSFSVASKIYNMSETKLRNMLYKSTRTKNTTNLILLEK